ncbi:MAG: hypothetical protein EAX86_10065 [Candidatus Heimdallarchaeota archaeon]|nr:hypothetical protein [Candidatus Heimdallarchaeota archaeon]
MIIKNLWIISNVGLCYYNYNAPVSDYEIIDENLFSGLVAGLSNFAISLSTKHKAIEYLKMGKDELHFETLGNIIVAAIISATDEKYHSFTVKTLLQFIGTKFLDMYVDATEDLLYDWDIDVNPFTNEIKNFIQDNDLLEDIKREQFQNLFNEVIADKLPIEYIHWRGIQLFADTAPNVINQALEMISGLEDVVPTIISDKIFAAQILDALRRLYRNLQLNVSKEDTRDLIIVCKNDDLYDVLETAFIGREIHPLRSLDFESLVRAINSMNSKNIYNILVVEENVSSKDLRVLHNLEMPSDCKIIMIVSKIPRLPKGRMTQHKDISFIIYETFSEINGKNPILEYLVTSLSEIN